MDTIPVGLTDLAQYLSCRIHDYDRPKIEKIEATMRYSGLRTLSRHTMLAIAHVACSRKRFQRLPPEFGLSEKAIKALMVHDKANSGAVGAAPRSEKGALSMKSEDLRKPEQPDGDATVKGFLVLSRLPFLLPGLAALTTGILIAVSQGYDPSYGLVWMSIIGIMFIMLATYYFNEYFDYEGDIINKTFIKFSGGSRALPDNMVPRPVARLAGYSSVIVLLAIAIIYLIYYFKDYPLLLPLGLFGAFCGLFYSHPPFRWAYHGIGEILIGGCYGVLQMISGFYLVSGVLDLKMLLVGLPASITIFLVIVANEFPDYQADKAVNKRNLIVRLGLPKGSKMYAAVMMLAYPSMLATIAVDMSPWIAIAGLPVLVLSLMTTALTLKGGYDKPSVQTKISGATLLANLLSSLMFIPVVFIW